MTREETELRLTSVASVKENDLPYGKGRNGDEDTWGSSAKAQSSRCRSSVQVQNTEMKEFIS